MKFTNRAIEPKAHDPPEVLNRGSTFPIRLLKS
jgi:hypothetical protein